MPRAGPRRVARANGAGRRRELSAGRVGAQTQRSPREAGFGWEGRGGLDQKLQDLDVDVMAAEAGTLAGGAQDIQDEIPVDLLVGAQNREILADGGDKVRVGEGGGGGVGKHKKRIQEPEKVTRDNRPPMSIYFCPCRILHG